MGCLTGALESIRRLVGKTTRLVERETRLVVKILVKLFAELLAACERVLTLQLVDRQAVDRQLQVCKLYDEEEKGLTPTKDV